MPETTTTASEESAKLQTRSTGIAELDNLLRGGFRLPSTHSHRSGLTVLIRGKAGTGKSTLALQIVTALAMEALRERIKEAPGFACQAKLAQEVRAQNVFLSIEQLKSELGAVWVRLMQGFLRRRVRILKRIGSDSVKGLLPVIGDAVDWMARFGLERSPELFLLLSQLYGRTDKDTRDIGALWCDLAAHPKACWQAFDRAGLSREKVIEKEQEIVNGLLRGGIAAFAPVNFRDGSDDGDEQDDGSRRETPYATWPTIESVCGMVESLPGAGKVGKLDVVACDGLSILSPDERSLVDFRNLVHLLRSRSRLAILVYEPVEGRESHLDHLCDLVVELAGRPTMIGKEGSYFVHELIIRKARYQETAYGWHPYKLRSWGIEVFPSIHFQVHQPNLLEDQFLDSFPRGLQDKDKKRNTHEFAGSYLELILNGIVSGSTTVVLGPRGTFKTSLSHGFLLAGRCALDQRGLVVSLIDDARTLRSGSGLSCPNCRAKCKPSFCNPACCNPELNPHSGINMFHQRPGCVLPSELLQIIRKRLEFGDSAGSMIRRLAFWDLTQIDHRFPMLRDDSMFLPALIAHFKDFRRGDAPVSSVIIGASNAKNAAAASVMADNVIFLRRGTRKSRNKVEEVLLAYVDRVQGHLGSEGKALFAFPVEDDKLVPVKYYSGETLRIVCQGGAERTVRIGAELDPDTGAETLAADLKPFRKTYEVRPTRYRDYHLENDKFGLRDWIEEIIRMQDIKPTA